MRLRNHFILGAAFIAVSYIGFADDTLPDADAASHGVARVSILNGDVSVRRNDSGEYVAAAVNAPVVAGDSLATGPSGRMELQFNSANLLRIGHDSEMRLTEFIPNRIGMEIARGTVTYRVLRNSGAQVEISTPTVSVRPAGLGAVRVTVLEDGLTLITARSGQAEIYTPRGVETLPTGQTMIARGSASDPEFQITAPISRDEWDDWSDSRDRALESSRGYQYVNADVAGVAELDSYGQWVNDPNYGEVWNPRVEADWAPYRNGRWVSVDYYGWSWLGDEPWGWAPYHYGNWFYGSAGWCWYPGPIYSRYNWRPAVVGFFGFGGGSGGFGFGFGNVGWAPLAPFETFRPWYGRGRSFAVVNNVNIYGSFRNARHNGLTGIGAGNFTGGRSGRTFAVSQNQIGRAGMVNGGLPFRATGASQRFSDRPTSFIPRGNAFSSRQFSSRGAQAFGTTGRSTGGQPGARGLTGNGFGQTGQSGRGAAGLQAAPGNRDSGWSRFGGNRGGSAPIQNSRGAAGLQSTPGNRDSNWNRFGGSRGGSAPFQNGRGAAGFQSTPANRDSGWNRFGGSRGGSAPIQNGRGAAGLQSVPGNRDSGWNRFGGSRGGSAPIQNGRGAAGLQSTPANRDSGWNRFGGNRGGSAPFQNGRGAAGLQSTPANRDSNSSRFSTRGGAQTIPQNGRGSAGFQSSPANRDSGLGRFSSNRGGPAPIQNGRGAAGLQSTPGNRDSNWSRFNTRGGAQTIPQNGRGSAGFQSSPVNRDFGGNRYGRAQGAFAPSAPTNPGYSGRSYQGGAGAMQRQYGSSARGSQPMAVPRQSPQVSRGFESRSTGNNYSFRGSGSAGRSAPSYSGNNAGRGNSAPRSSGSSNGGGARGGGGHDGKHGR